jgi:3-deoxy-D-arabino-heptulosonate 7-phosphate (DAHP) synthase
VLAEARGETGCRSSPLTDVRELEPELDVADVIQIGARNMPNISPIKDALEAVGPP